MLSLQEYITIKRDMVSTIPVVSRALPHVHGMSPEVLLNSYAYIAYGLCGRDEQCWKSRKPLMERGMPVQKRDTKIRTGESGLVTRVF